MSLPDGATDKYNAYFKAIPVGTLEQPPLGKVVTVKSTDSVKEATRSLATHGILSAPVRKADAKEDDAWLEKYMGTADAGNLMFWLLKESAEDEEHEGLETLLRKDAGSHPISDAINLDPATSRFAPFTPLDPEHNTMLDCMLLMGKYALHRCYVVKPGGDVINIVTQSMLVRFLRDHLEQFKELGAKTVAELNLGTRGDVYTAQTTDTFMAAFAKMQEHGVSALPMVDDKNIVKGVVSARDARLLLLRPTRLRFIHKSLSFFEDLHIEPFGWQTVCVTDKTTLAEVVQKLAETQIHRVFITNEAHELQGVISLRDVLACFVKEPSDSKLSEYFSV